MASRRPKAQAQDSMEPLELDTTPEPAPEPAHETSPESSHESLPESSPESLPSMDPVLCKGCGTKAAPEQTVNLYIDLDTMMTTIVGAANLPAEVAEQVLAEAGRNWEFTSVFKNGRWSVHLSRSGAVDIATDPVIGLI